MAVTLCKTAIEIQCSFAAAELRISLSSDRTQDGGGLLCAKLPKERPVIQAGQKLRGYVMLANAAITAAIFLAGGIVYCLARLQFCRDATVAACSQGLVRDLIVPIIKILVSQAVLTIQSEYVNKLLNQAVAGTQKPLLLMFCAQQAHCFDHFTAKAV